MVDLTQTLNGSAADPGRNYFFFLGLIENPGRCGRNSVPTEVVSDCLARDSVGASKCGGPYTCTKLANDFGYITLTNP